MKSRYAEALTPREREVIELLSTGLTNEEIARQLGISLDGVKYHVSGIFRRLRVKNRHEAASLHLGSTAACLRRASRKSSNFSRPGSPTRRSRDSSASASMASNTTCPASSGVSMSRAGARRLRCICAPQGSGRLAALAPLMFLRKLPFGWLAKAAAGGALTTTVAGDRVARLGRDVDIDCHSAHDELQRRAERRQCATCAPDVAPARGRGGRHHRDQRDVRAEGRRRLVLGQRRELDSHRDLAHSGLGETGVSAISTGGSAAAREGRWRLVLGSGATVDRHRRWTPGSCASGVSAASVRH